jgi:hypothetical protein
MYLKLKINVYFIFLNIGDLTFGITLVFSEWGFWQRGHWVQRSCFSNRYEHILVLGMTGLGGCLSQISLTRYCCLGWVCRWAVFGLIGDSFYLSDGINSFWAAKGWCIRLGPNLRIGFKKLPLGIQEGRTYLDPKFLNGLLKLTHKAICVIFMCSGAFTQCSRLCYGESPCPDSPKMQQTRLNAYLCFSCP